ncbi:13964_t:CDS:1, partial [Funneliformis geosporum]
MLDKKNINLELEIKVLKAEEELKEKKREKGKLEDTLITVIMTFIFCAGA